MRRASEQGGTLLVRGLPSPWAQETPHHITAPMESSVGLPTLSVGSLAFVHPTGLLKPRVQLSISLLLASVLSSLFNLQLNLIGIGLFVLVAMGTEEAFRNFQNEVSDCKVGKLLQEMPVFT